MRANHKLPNHVMVEKKVTKINEHIEIDVPIIEATPCYGIVLDEMF